MRRCVAVITADVMTAVIRDTDAIPKNITPHETGIKAYTYEDFQKMIETGVRKDGGTLDKIMPIEALAKMDEIERQALWAYLRSVPPKAFGGR